MKWLTQIKDFIYKKNIVENEKEPINDFILNQKETSPLKLNSLGVPVIQNLFLLEIFFYTMQSVIIKEKQIDISIKDLKINRKVNEESFNELTIQLDKLKKIMKRYQSTFIVKIEDINIQGVRKSVNNIYLKNIPYSDYVNTINSEWLNSNESYNRKTRELLDEIKLNILIEMRDGGVQDIDYSGLNKKDDPPEAQGKINFKKMKL